MFFDRPTVIQLFVKATITRKDSAIPADPDLIKQSLVARAWGLNENALASDLYRTVYDAGTAFVATDLQISLDGTTYTLDKLDTAPDQKFSIATADITLTEVV
jgi:hypothetical protein